MKTLRALLLTPLTGIAVLAAAISASAANHYVRSDATGAADGSNWTDAWTNLPATLVRGDTYFIAGGTYAGAITLNTPDSGGTWIYIRKATPSDHGTPTGWQDSYGTSNALFTGPWALNTDYWDMDGRTGSERAGYGFEVYYNTTTADNIFEITGSNINFQHMNVHAYPEGSSPKDSMGDPTGGPLGYYQGMKLDHSSNLYFGHCYIHHLYGCPFQPVNANNDECDH